MATQTMQQNRMLNRKPLNNKPIKPLPKKRLKRKRKPIAVEAGLDEGTAERLADQNSSKAPDEFKKIAEDYKLQRDIDTAKGFSKNTYSQGFNYEGYSPSRSSSSSCVNFRCTTWDGTTDSGKTVYNQKYSVVVGSYAYRNGRQNGYYVNENSFDVEVKGLKTSNEAIPTEGSATYTGKSKRG
ncbi:MAG: hypothetical protein SOS93_09090 [Mannheimia varigena]|nr:hypothetical protein [Mannheimia varigena]